MLICFQPHRTIELGRSCKLVTRVKHETTHDVVARVVKQRSTTAFPRYTEKVDSSAFGTGFGEFAETTVDQLEVRKVVRDS